MDTNGSDFGYIGAGYQGKRLDPESGNWDYMSRPGSPVLQFTQRDKIGYAGGTANLYGFIGQNPIVYVDPDGLQSVTATIANSLVTSAANFDWEADRAMVNNIANSIAGLRKGALASGEGTSVSPYNSEAEYRKNFYEEFNTLMKRYPCNDCSIASLKKSRNFWWDKGYVDVGFKVAFEEARQLPESTSVSGHGIFQTVYKASWNRRSKYMYQVDVKVECKHRITGVVTSHDITQMEKWFWDSTNGEDMSKQLHGGRYSSVVGIDPPNPEEPNYSKSVPGRRPPAPPIRGRR